MIVAIKIRNFKGIRASPLLELDPFHVLVGPNGSGKSTFLDAIEFVKSCLVNGPAAAVEERVPEYRDLTFLRAGGPIEFDIDLRFLGARGEPTETLRYRFGIAADEKVGVKVSEESLTQSAVKLLGKRSTGVDFYRRESGKSEDSFQFGPGKLALSLTPPDQKKYPTGNLVKTFLAQGVRFVQLDSRAMRQPALATRSTELELDGTNLPRVVGSLLRNGSSKPADNGKLAVARWTDHLRYALEDLESVGWAARAPDNAEYLVLRFAGGLECPSPDISQ